MTAGFREFEFDLPDALLTGLIKTFDRMEGASLTQAHLLDIPEAQGVYQLLYGDETVYVGKTDADAGLRRRLERHAWNIQHRRGLEVDQVFFKALRVFVFTAMDLEGQLIAHYKNIFAIRWNNSGFGSNDPGRNRDKTRAKAEGFDVLFPIDVDRKISLTESGSMTVARVLTLLRKEVPYIIRTEGADGGLRTIHPDLLSTNIVMTEGSTSARSVLSAVVNALPAGWQATLLSGRIILYKEHEEYTAGAVIARR